MGYPQRATFKQYAELYLPALTKDHFLSRLDSNPSSMTKDYLWIGGGFCWGNENAFWMRIKKVNKLLYDS